jgi:hypothetical protein
MTWPATAAYVAGVAPRTRRARALVALLSLVLAAGAVAAGGPATAAAAGEPPVEIGWQEPFLCTTEGAGLGQPTPDNDEGRGTPVYPEDAGGAPDRTQDPVGWSEACQVEAQVSYHYRDADGELRDLPAGTTELPDDVALLDVDGLVGADEMALDGAEAIPYVLRLERGTLPEQRFLYSIAMLVPWAVVQGETDRSHDHWNGRLLYSFDGGVAIGRSQGSLSTSGGTFDDALRLGHAVLYSSGTATSVHYNLIRGGLTAVEAKQTFADRHGEPRYTVGIGGSGGGIQQYVYAQNHPGVLDAAIPLYAYPDMTTQTIHTGDCELLERYMDVDDADNPRWRDWDARRLVQGMNSIEGYESSWQEVTGATGSSECIEGWRGLTPLAMNPRFGFADGLDDALLAHLPEVLGKIGAGEPPVPEHFPDMGRLLRVAEDPGDWVEWTHWADVEEVYGTDPATGLTRVPWDNVGVQYGLRAVAGGQLSPEEFLDLNARVGSWREGADAQPESCGLVEQMVGSEMTALARAIGACEGNDLDQYSARQMVLSEDPEVPAPRRAGDVEAIRAAFESGLVFHGDLEPIIPIIDARHHLEHELDMHNVHQSFAVRERIRRAEGNHDHHLIWFLDARPEIDRDATSRLLQGAFRLVDEWMANIAAHPSGDVVASRPEAAVDSCFDTDGDLIAAGDDVWAGAVELILTGEGAWEDEAPTEVGGQPVGSCARAFPLHSTSRIVAGGPITGDVYKCHLMPVRDAVDAGLYGVWQPTDDEVARLEEIHPEGVCDHSRPSVGHPDPEPATVDGDELAASPTSPAGDGGDGGTSWGLPVVAGLVLLAGLCGAMAVGRRRRSGGTSAG